MKLGTNRDTIGSFLFIAELHIVPRYLFIIYLFTFPAVGQVVDDGDGPDTYFC